MAARDGCADHIGESDKDSLRDFWAERSQMTPARGTLPIDAIPTQYRQTANLVIENGTEVAAEIIGVHKLTIERQIDKILKA